MFYFLLGNKDWGKKKVYDSNFNKITVTQFIFQQLKDIFIIFVYFLEEFLNLKARRRKKGNRKEKKERKRREPKRKIKKEGYFQKKKLSS